MIRSVLIAVSLLCASLISGCASVPMASQSADSAAKSYKADAGTANIYVYRNETFGAAIKMSVSLDGSAMGETASKTYLLKRVAPGQHTITSQGKNTISLEAKAGQNYFVWQEVKMGLVAAGSKLTVVDESTGKAGVAECKLAQ